MKIIKFLTIGLVLAFGFSACSLDSTNYDDSDSGSAFTNLRSVQSGTTGVYYWTGHYAFLGNYAVSLGDFCAGVSAGSSSSGHFYALSSFAFSDTQAELSNVWNAGYKIITNATRTINGANHLIESGAIVESEHPEAYAYIGQCYALKALAAYYLVNYYALPYSSANASTPGILLVDEEVPSADQQVSRATVQQTYDQIVKDITSAENAFDLAGTAGINAATGGENAFYMTPMGLAGLKARVYMALGQYEIAEEAAKEALDLKGATGDASDNVPSDADYLTMWTSLNESDEDLFTVKKSSEDNLSANALNTLYGSYYCTLQNAALNMLGNKDIRRDLTHAGDKGGTTTAKYDGIATSATTSNIPVMRKSEMSLIIAECEARAGHITQAQNYLFYTAKRDKSITAPTDLPSTTAELLEFISEERIREFMGEGHRFIDARRMGDIVTMDGFNPWDIQKFVFPIPAGEINSGFGTTQNEGWSGNMPTRN
ncbi:MAG TPA: RagB/SusD family nutrient uptake outer membrane protein [Candidatus Prevotella avicola]|uniref:RagB/SusD family nutrient uptake outer membrane protein n=1 Tax=Candidatus Prevotella avicola TaxID=2838738 RepID=A0A9D2FZB2_9BACT|nr:RagB/SusD family nutrient uptake outer membrane protein [Candidatus Prevotella avicola]